MAHLPRGYYDARLWEGFMRCFRRKIATSALRARVMLATRGYDEVVYRWCLLNKTERCRDQLVSALLKFLLFTFCGFRIAIFAHVPTGSIFFFEISFSTNIFFEIVFCFGYIAKRIENPNLAEPGWPFSRKSNRNVCPYLYRLDSCRPGSFFFYL